MNTKRKLKFRRFTDQYRSCSFCCSVDGLVVSENLQQGDTVSCHVCGNQYLVERMDPLRLQALQPQEKSWNSYLTI